MRADPHRLNVADELLLVTHDRYTGKPLLPDFIIGLGLAAALLGELVLDQRIRITDQKHHIIITDSSAPPDDVAHGLLRQLVNEVREVPGAREWMHYLARDKVYHRIGERLARTSPPVVRPTEIRSGAFKLKRATVYPPVEPAAPDRVTGYIYGKVKRRSLTNRPDLLLAGLMEAMELDSEVDIDWTQQDRNYFHACIRGLPSSLGSLVAEAKAAIGDAPLTHLV